MWMAIVSLLTLFSQFLNAYELAIVSLFRNTAPYMREWVEFHRMAGVDHFWLYNDESTDNWEEVLRPYIEEGLVEVFLWPAGKPDHIAGQIRAMQDGLNRAIGNTTWVALIDQDEFLLPRKHRTITECLSQHFSEASAVYVNWRNFGTSGLWIPLGEPFLLRLTQCSIKKHPRNIICKSIVRPEAAILDQIWYPHHVPLKPGCQYLDGDGHATLRTEGTDLQPDGNIHTRFLRINHYPFRDENYFQIRLESPNAGYGGGKEFMTKHYKDYSKDEDFEIINYIKKTHRDSYKKIWRKYK